MASRSRDAAISSLIRIFSRALNRSRLNGISIGLNRASRCSMSGATADQSIGTAERSAMLEKIAASRVMAAHLTLVKTRVFTSDDALAAACAGFGDLVEDRPPPTRRRSSLAATSLCLTCSGRELSGEVGLTPAVVQVREQVIAESELRRFWLSLDRALGECDRLVVSLPAVQVVLSQIEIRERKLGALPKKRTKPALFLIEALETARERHQSLEAARVVRRVLDLLGMLQPCFGELASARQHPRTAVVGASGLRIESQRLVGSPDRALGVSSVQQDLRDRAAYRRRVRIQLECSGEQTVGSGAVVPIRRQLPEQQVEARVTRKKAHGFQKRLLGLAGPVIAELGKSQRDREQRIGGLELHGLSQDARGIRESLLAKVERTERGVGIDDAPVVLYDLLEGPLRLGERSLLHPSSRLEKAVVDPDSCPRRRPREVRGSDRRRSGQVTQRRQLRNRLRIGLARRNGKRRLGPALRQRRQLALQPAPKVRIRRCEILSLDAVALQVVDLWVGRRDQLEPPILQRVELAPTEVEAGVVRLGVRGSLCKAPAASDQGAEALTLNSRRRRHAEQLRDRRQDVHERDGLGMSRPRKFSPRQT